jgi:hypothetical protein
MEKNFPYKKTTFSQTEESRKKGRPKLSWLDSVLKYVKLFELQTWWKKAFDMNIWGRSSRKPRSIQDCRARGRISLYEYRN